MVMNSNQIMSIFGSQQAMYAGMQRPVGYGSPYGVGMGPAPPPGMMPMTGAWNPMGMSGGFAPGIAGMGYGAVMSPGSGAEQVLSERLMGAGLGAARFGVAGFNLFNPLSDPMSAGMTAGLGALGMGSMGMTGLAGAGMATGIGIPFAASAMALQYGVNQIGTGFQQRRAVNQVLRNRFGGMMGIGGGRGGMGFGEQEMGQISSMVREMGTTDIFSSTEEMTRLLDKTASMGLYRGVQNAREFRTRFRELTNTLREISQTMQVTLEDATQFMESGRRMGFFTGQDITRNMMQTRYGAQATGLSVGQVQQLGMTGAQMGRALGMRGRVGAGAMQQAGLNIATAMRSGIISEEMAAEATGGLTGPEAVQALAQRTMELNASWIRGRPGQAMLAGLWDPSTGGINQARLEQYQRGELSIRQLRGMGRQNIAATGGRRSEFFIEQDRLGGVLQEAAGGDPLFLSGIAEHVARRRGTAMNDPMTMRVIQKLMQRQGQNVELSELEEMITRHQNMPMIQAQRRGREQMALEQDARNRVMQRQGIGGLERRLSHEFTERVENPLRRIGDRMTTQVSEAVRGIVDEFEGRVKTQMTEETKQAMEEMAMFGRVVTPGLGPSPIAAPMSTRTAAAYTRSLERSRTGTMLGPMRGTARWWGEKLGVRPTSSLAVSAYAMGVVDPRSALIMQQQERGQITGGIDAGTRRNIEAAITAANERAQQTGAQMGFSEGALDVMAKSAQLIITENYAPGSKAYAEFRRRAEGDEANQSLAAKHQIAMLSSKSATMAAAFRKARGPDGRDFASELALLRDLTGRTALAGTTLAAPAVAGGAAFASLEAELESYRSRRGEAIAAIAGTRVHGKERTERIGGIRGIIPGIAHQRIQGSTDIGAVGTVEAVTELTQNEAVMRNLNALRSGDAAARRQALSDLRIMSTDSAQISNADSRSALVNMLNTGVREANGNVTLTNQFRHNLGVIQDSVRREQGTMVRQRERELGRWMQQGLREAGYMFEEAGQSKNFSTVQEIARLRASASQKDLERAQSLERQLFSDPSAQDPAFRDILSKVKGAEYLANGLSYTADLAQRLSGKGDTRRGVTRGGRAIEEIMKAGGLEGLLDPRGATLRSLQTAAGGGDESLMGRLESIARKKGGEWLEKFNRSKAMMGELSDVFRLSGTGGANVTQEEAQRLATQMGVRLSQGQRLEGAPSERVASAELQLKMVEHLKKQIVLQIEMARALGVSEGTLKDIRTGQHWFTKEPEPPTQ